MAGRGADVSDEEILEVFERLDGPIHSTSDIAAELSIKQQATYLRLTELKEEGRVYQKEVGTGNVWWDEATNRAFEKAADQWDT